MEARMPSTYPKVCRGRSMLSGKVLTIHIHNNVPTIIIMPLAIRGTFSTTVRQNLHVQSNVPNLISPNFNVICPDVIMMLCISAIVISFITLPFC